MSFNYRVIVRFEASGEPYFNIHECHYSRKSAKLPHSWTMDPEAAMGGSLEGLRADCRRMLKATMQPVLVEYLRKDGKERLKVWSGKCPKPAIAALTPRDGPALNTTGAEADPS